MSDFLRRLSGVAHQTVAGLAGKPSAIVNVHLPETMAETIPEQSAAQVEAQAQCHLAPETARSRSIKVGRWASDWCDLVEHAAKECKVDARELWVLFHSDGAGSPLQVCTSFRQTFVAACDTARCAGPVHGYARFPDARRMIREMKNETVEVHATRLTFSKGSILQDLPFAADIEKTAVRPVPVPTDGYIPVRGLWLAMHEAFRFSIMQYHARGLHAVHVHPLRDGTNQVAVYGIGDTQAYRRILTAPGITKPLTILPRWAFMSAPPNSEEDVLGVIPAGVSYVWIRFPNNIIIGDEMPALAFPSNVPELFLGLEGRVDFTPDEARTFRRGVLAAKPMMLGPGGSFGAIGIKPETQSISIRGESASTEVPCRGDAGEEILVDPDLLVNGLAVKDILSVEFAKGDPESRFRLVGRDVAVAIQPIEKED